MTTHNGSFNGVEERLVELVFADLPTVAGWGQRIGLETNVGPAGEIVNLYNPHLDFRTAYLPQSDPTTRAVCLAAAVAGIHWTQAFPNLLDRVNREWWFRIKKKYTE